MLELNACVAELQKALSKANQGSQETRAHSRMSRGLERAKCAVNSRTRFVNSEMRCTTSYVTWLPTNCRNSMCRKGNCLIISYHCLTVSNIAFAFIFPSSHAALPTTRVDAFYIRWLDPVSSANALARQAPAYLVSEVKLPRVGVGRGHAAYDVQPQPPPQRRAGAAGRARGVQGQGPLRDDPAAAVLG